MKAGKTTRKIIWEKKPDQYLGWDGIRIASIEQTRQLVWNHKRGSYEAVDLWWWEATIGIHPRTLRACGRVDTLEEAMQLCQASINLFTSERTIRGKTG